MTDYNPYGTPAPRPSRRKPTRREITGNTIAGAGVALNIAAGFTVFADIFAARAGGDLLSGDEWMLATLAGPVGMSVFIGGAVMVMSERRTAKDRKE